MLGIRPSVDRNWLNTSCSCDMITQFHSIISAANSFILRSIWNSNVTDDAKSSWRRYTQMRKPRSSCLNLLNKFLFPLPNTLVVYQILSDSQKSLFLSIKWMLLINIPHLLPFAYWLTTVTYTLFYTQSVYYGKHAWYTYTYTSLGIS